MYLLPTSPSWGQHTSVGAHTLSGGTFRRQPLEAWAPHVQGRRGAQPGLQGGPGHPQLPSATPEGRGIKVVTSPGAGGPGSGGTASTCSWLLAGVSWTRRKKVEATSTQQSRGDRVGGRGAPADPARPWRRGASEPRRRPDPGAEGRQAWGRAGAPRSASHARWAPPHGPGPGSGFRPRDGDMGGEVLSWVLGPPSGLRGSTCPSPAPPETCPLMPPMWALRQFLSTTEPRKFRVLTQH